MTQLALGFWPSRALSAAVELGVFAALGAGALTAGELTERLGLRARAAPDFLDALVALGLLVRSGDRYANSPEAAAYLDPSSPTHLGALVAGTGASARARWEALPDALRTGGERTPFDAVLGDAGRLEAFVQAMAAVAAPAWSALVRAFDFSSASTVCDVGGGGGHLATVLAARQPGLQVTTFDLPELAPIARRTIAAAGVDDRVTVAEGDFFVDPVPAADVLVMSFVLLDWDVERKGRLLEAARAALPDGGALLVVDRFDDGGGVRGGVGGDGGARDGGGDDRPARSSFQLLQELDRFLEHGDAHTYTTGELSGWCAGAGFSSFSAQPLTERFGLAIARR